MNKARVHIFISGKVQGVFFRQALKVTSVKNSVYGSVRNLDDGRVEAILEGDENKISNVVEWCHTGPANSRVEHVEVKNEKPTGLFSSFDVLYE